MTTLIDRPKVPLVVLNPADIVQTADGLGIELLRPLEQGKRYHYTTDSGWHRALEYVMGLVDNMHVAPAGHLGDGGHALFVKGLIEEIFDLGTCGLAWGDVDQGEGGVRGKHAFNLVWVPGYFRVFDPTISYRGLFDIRQEPYCYSVKSLLI